MAEPEFFYDFNSPFAYLGASRVDDVLPVRPRWRPIAFGVIVRQSGKRPWSFDEDTRGGVIDEIAVRAADRGLPPLRIPRAGRWSRIRWPHCGPPSWLRTQAGCTDEALARGIDGVPTVAVGDELFWGDDRLEDAAAALTTA